MAETYNKKEKEKKKQQRKKEKLARKEERKESSKGGGLENMMAYVDDNGVIRDTPQDPSEKKAVKASSIEIGIPKKEKEDVDPFAEGVIHYFDDSKGYGFIKEASGDTIFVHINNITGDPAVQKKVRYMKEKQPRGWVAVNVTLI